MMTYMELSLMVKGLIALWFTVLLLPACAAAFRLFTQKNFRIAIPSVAVVLVIYILVQWCCNITRGHVQRVSIHAPALLAGVGWIWLFLVAVLLTALNIGFLLYAQRWHKAHVNVDSVKEGIDDLPAGLCWYAEDGTLILHNHAMEQLCLQITGHNLYDGKMLEEELRRQIDDSQVMTLDDGTVWSVRFHTLENHRAVLHEICTYNITEEYQVTRLLMEKQEEVQQAGKNLMNYNRELAQMITAEEILAAKVRIHDELGQCLLMTKKYLLRGGMTEDRERLLQVLRKNNTLMEKSDGESSRSYLDIILEAASDMGVHLIIDGAMPEKQTISDIITTAIHENLTNTIRHAQGDEMRVEIREDHGSCTAVFTNSGRLPDGPVEERGGIGILRTLVESTGGEMSVENAPRFKMTLRFNIEG